MHKSGYLLIGAALLSGCVSTKVEKLSDNEYQLFKNSDACAVGSANSVMKHLRSEAVKICAGSNEVPLETESSVIKGIPVVRCTSGKLRFKCEPAKPSN